MWWKWSSSAKQVWPTPPFPSSPSTFLIYESNKWVNERMNGPHCQSDPPCRTLFIHFFLPFSTFHVTKSYYREQKKVTWSLALVKSFLAPLLRPSLIRTGTQSLVTWKGRADAFPFTWWCSSPVAFNLFHCCKLPQLWLCDFIVFPRVCTFFSSEAQMRERKGGRKRAWLSHLKLKIPLCLINSWSHLIISDRNGASSTVGQRGGKQFLLLQKEWRIHGDALTSG